MYWHLHCMHPTSKKKQKTSNFFVPPRHSVKSEPHHTQHGDKEGPYHSCSSKTNISDVQFCHYGRWKSGGIHPLLRPHNSGTSWVNTQRGMVNLCRNCPKTLKICKNWATDVLIFQNSINFSVLGPTSSLLHRWGWNMVWVKSPVPNFTPTRISTECRHWGAKNLKMTPK